MFKNTREQNLHNTTLLEIPKGTALRLCANIINRINMGEMRALHSQLVLVQGSV